MYILKHDANICNVIRPKQFKTKKALRQFLRRRKWEKRIIDILVSQGTVYSWILIKEGE